MRNINRAAVKMYKGVQRLNEKPYKPYRYMTINERINVRSAIQPDGSAQRYTRTAIVFAEIFNCTMIGKTLFIAPR